MQSQLKFCSDSQTAFQSRAKTVQGSNRSTAPSGIFLELCNNCGWMPFPVPHVQ